MIPFSTGKVGANIDSVAESISKIETSLTSIDKLLGSIGKKSGELKRATTSASQVGSSATGASGPTKAFDLGASFGGQETSGSRQMVSGFISGGSGAAPAAAGAPKGMGVGKGLAVVGLGAVSGAWNTLPELQEARDQRQAMFRATLNTGSGMPNYDGLKRTMQGAFGGYATSTTSQEQVASLMASYGMAPKVGMSTSSASYKFMQQTSAMSLLTGKSNESMAQLGMSISRPENANSMLLMGVSSVNADGSPKDFQRVAADIIKKTYGGKAPTKEQIERGSRADGILRRNLTIALGAEGADTALAYAAAASGEGQFDQDFKLDPKTMEKKGLTNEKRNPFARESKHTGTRSDTISKYSDELIAGWDKALDAAEKLEHAAQSLEKVLAPLAYGKGFGHGFLGTHSGNAAVGALDGILGAGVGSALGGAIMGRFGGNGLVGKGLGKLGLGRLGGAAAPGGAAAGGGGAAGGGAAAGALGPLAILGAAIAVEGGLQTGIDKGFSRYGADPTGSRKSRTIASGLRFAMKVGLNPGRAPVELRRLWHQKESYGDRKISPYGTVSASSVQQQYPTATTPSGSIPGGYDPMSYDPAPLSHSGSVMGTEGGGASGAAGGLTQRPSNKGGKSVATGTSGAVARALREVEKPSKNWDNLCDNFVAVCYGRSYSGYRTAYDHWKAIPEKLRRKDGSPPAGALVFWFTGEGRAGHVALSLGGGKVASNDILRRGKIDVVTIGLITSKWGARYLGWTPPYFGGSIVAGGADKSEDSGDQGPSSQNVPGSQQQSAPSSAGPSVHSLGQAFTANRNGAISGGLYSIASQVKSSMVGLMGAVGVNLMTTGSNPKKEQVGQDAPAPSEGAESAVGNITADKSYTRESFAAGVLKNLGIKQTDANMKAMLRWMQQEGGHWNNKAAFNPLNTSWKMGGGAMNGDGVQVYRNWEEGMKATVKTLSMGSYAAIRKALANGSEKDVYKAILASPWGTRDLPAYSEGSWRIEKDKIAKIHEGEMIIPASIAEAVRTGVRKSFAGQNSGNGVGASHVTIEFRATGNLNYDASELIELVKKSISQDEMFSTIGGA